MRKRFGYVFGLLSLSVFSAQASQNFTHPFPDRILTNDVELVRNGRGRREATLFKLKVYEAALYLKAPNNDPTAILSSTEPKVIELKSLRDVSRIDSEKAWTAAFELNCKPHCKAARPAFEIFKTLLRDVKTGDVYRYVFKANGVEILLEGTKIGSVDGGLFSTVLLATWLGTNPPNESLKLGLLGVNDEKGEGKAMLGIIGGTGLYRLDNLKILDERHVTTPFGDPSAPLVFGEYGGNRVAFLPRHGLHHEILPSEINFRANIYALKSVGVRNVLSVSATGSLREKLRPADLALVSQYFDHTRGRRSGSFFGDGLVAHVSTAEPSAPELALLVQRAAEKTGISIHAGATYACVEGPRLGTRAESLFLRDAGCDLVGMTNVPEAFLAREAQLGYCTIAIVTDYDCWLEDSSQHAQADKIIELYMQNIDRVKKLVAAVIAESVPDGAVWSCHRALEGAVLSREESLSAEKRDLLNFLRM